MAPFASTLNSYSVYVVVTATPAGEDEIELSMCSPLPSTIDFAVPERGSR
jgi:hypothetical protein